jgi:PAS domain S-box-containing protein
MRHRVERGRNEEVSTHPSAEDKQSRSTATFRAPDLSSADLCVLWDDGEFVLSRVVRREQLPLLMVTPVSRQPPPETVARLEHAYGLRDELDPDWTARPLAMVRCDGRPTLLLEDPGGEVLAGLIGPPWEVATFLRVAIGIAAALGRLHALGLIHKAIRPANILVDVPTGRAWFTGFRIASRLPREPQPPELPEVTAGTLAYVAPEQTGRMNRSVDQRSDLYALGVTLYEMLTGTLPFTASDPIEWVHCHIARQPLPPAERRSDLSPALSAIIVKLLAKTAEERYQTAAGVESDLQRCLADWECHGGIRDFVLGQGDTPDRLLIPEKLYGRVSEIETLLASFERVISTGTPEMVLVSGYSGIGKSSVVNELHKSLVPPRGLFASGKFDQYKRDIPYATLAQAFQSLVRSLLGKSEADLRIWRDAFRDALGPNGLLIVDLVPELKHIIGEQPPVPVLPPRDAQRRFQLVFRRFIGVFARPEHPLALFLDDLQWLDAATLELLEDLLIQPDVEHLMVIGAFRDNEVDSAHPLMRTIATIRQAGMMVRDIILAPLAREDLGQLLADALNCAPQHVARLADVVHAKTAGNPLFAIQFISALAEEGLIAFDHRARQWSWDLGRIHAKRYTDNVVDLMVGKIVRLPAETQQALHQLACLGDNAEFVMLQVVCECSAEDMHRRLWEAVRAGLIFRTNDAYRFLHDRVQEAAYSLIPDEFRAETHLRIGRLFAAHVPPERQEEKIFEIVNQFNHGAVLITSPEERERVARLNLVAGKRAKTSTAYASALQYLAAGRALLAEESWTSHYDLIFEIECNMAECELLTADMGTAEHRLLALAQRAKRDHDIAIVTRLRLTLYTTLDQSDRAVEVCLEYLRRGGTQWSPHPTSDEVQREYDRIGSQLGTRAIEELIDLPLMTNRDVLDALDVLTEAVTPAHFTDENLGSLVICRLVNLSLEHGNSDGSCFAYVWFAIIAGPRFGNYEAGFQFGQLGYDLVEKRGLRRFQARTYMSFGDIVLPWTRHVRAGRDLVRRAFDAANEIGDITFACYCCDHLVKNMLAAGDPLVDVQREAEKGLQFAQKAGFGLVIDQVAAQLGLTRTLRGLTREFGSFNNEEFDELQFERHLADNPALAEVDCWYSVRKLQARFFAGDHAGAIAASLSAQRQLWTSPSQFETAELCFYGALSHSASWDSASAEDTQDHFEALTRQHRQLEVWAEHCPDNFEDRAALVGAEVARIEGRDLDAMRLYEQAGQSARRNGFVHNEGIANELAARFYAARGFEQIAQLYLRNAFDCYRRWGADGKVRQLEELHAQFREPPSLLNPATAIAPPNDRLDLTAAVRASEAVSGEIVLQQVIETLMVLALQQAGADRGLLILSRDDELRIEAQATTVAGRVIVDCRQDPATTTDLPESILRYVARTRQSVIVDDAAAENPFAPDAYLRRRHVRSILCLPLVKQTALVGVLYLENNLARGAFTPARIEWLTLLASQAALSLENARLYSDLKQAESNVRQILDLVPHHISVLSCDGTHLYANQVSADYFGLTVEDLQDSDGEVLMRRFMHPDDAEAARAASERGFAGTGPWEIEARFRRRDGEYRWFLGRFVPLHDDEGRILRWYSTGTDIDDRKKAEEKIRQDERELRLLFEVIPQHIAVLDVDGRVLDANRAALEFRGFRTPEELQSAFETNMAALFHADDLPKLRDTARAALASGLPFEREVRARRHDGQYRWYLVRYAPLSDEHGHVIRWYVTATDIDDRKRAEERAHEETLALREELDRTSMFEEIVGTSPPLRGVLADISRVAPTDSTVLITGETGTGKELVARAIHKRSGRSSRGFVSVNCASIPPTLIASELFGHEKGAFTGALTRRLGRFELADGGTIFLDEIGELPADTQLALLRVLQEREFERLGSTRVTKVDVRVIAATNRDLKAAMTSGAFRPDLFYRLTVFPIEVPPLRERTTDIPLLVAYFVNRYASKAGKAIRNVDKRTLDLVQSYRWPGNVRELQNVIERAVIVCESDTLIVDENWLSRETVVTDSPARPLGDTLVAREREMIEAALAETKGKVAGRSGAAAKLGMPASTLESRIRALRIRKHQYKPS